MKSLLLIFCIVFFANHVSAQHKKYDTLIKEGKQALDQNKNQLAKEKFESAFKIDPKQFDALYGLGLTYFYDCAHTGTNCNLCVDYLNKAIKIDSNKGKLYYTLGRCKGIMHDFESALMDMDIAIRKHPDTSAYTSRALIKVQLGDLNGACWDFYQSSKLGSILSEKMFNNNCGSKK